MPINRDDGRHWCDPASEPVEDSPWTCPDCGTVWVADTTNGVLWTAQPTDDTPEDDEPDEESTDETEEQS